MFLKKEMFYEGDTNEKVKDIIYNNGNCTYRSYDVGINMYCR